MLAIVLSRRDFRENDQVISVYTREQGKLELLARGIKKIISKNSAHVEPFSVIDIDLAQGKELNYLTKVQPIEYFGHIRRDFDKSMMAQYVVELIDRLIHVGEVDERLFDLLHNWLGVVSTGQLSKVNCQLLVDGYIVTLLHCLGFSLSQDERMKDRKWLEFIELCDGGEWEKIVEYGMQNIEYRKFHKFVHERVQYYTERKIADWEKTCVM